MMIDKEIIVNAVKSVLGIAFFTVFILPFVAPAYIIVRLFGVDPFSMDSMGIGFGIMVVVAIGIAVAAASFALGTLV